MAALNFPSTDLVPNVTTYSANNKTWLWDGTSWLGDRVIDDLIYLGTLTGSTEVINIGSGQIYKDADGHVGIGTSSVGSYLFNVNGTSNFAGAVTLGGTVSGGGNQINNVIIGTSTPLAGTFTVATANSFVPNSATVPANGLYLPASNSIGFATNTTARGKYDANGNLIHGTAALATTATNGFFWIPSCAGTPTGAPSAPYSNATALIADSSEGKLYFRIGAGSWTAVGSGSGATITDDTTTNDDYYLGMSSATTGAWTTAYVSSSKLYFNPSTGTLSSTIFSALSDERLKTDFQPILGALDTVKKFNPVSFNWKDTGVKSYGLIAQEVELVLPEAVITGSVYKTLNYYAIFTVMLAAIKELTDEVNNLKSLVAI